MAELPTLYTSRWGNHGITHLDVVPVGISRGVPKFPVRYHYRRIRELEPDGWMLGIEDDTRFEESYRRKLDRLGVDRIAGLLRRISVEEGGRPLALLCFEDVHRGQVCHRRMLARWLEERSDIEVPELEPGMVEHRLHQPSLFERGGRT